MRDHDLRFIVDHEPQYPANPAYVAVSLGQQKDAGGLKQRIEVLEGKLNTLLNHLQISVKLDDGPKWIATSTKVKR